MRRCWPWLALALALSGCEQPIRIWEIRLNDGTVERVNTPYVSAAYGKLCVDGGWQCWPMTAVKSWKCIR